MSRSTVTFVALMIAGSLAVACSSTDKSTAKKPASGQAASPTTKKPATTPAPKQKVASNVASNQTAAAKTEAECAPADEGKGACIDDFVVFCAGGALYALDCAAAFGGSCGETDVEVGCLVPESAAD